MALTQTAKEFFAPDVGASVAGVALLGLLPGAFFGELVKATFDLTEWKAVLGKAAIRIPLAVGAFAVGRGMMPGIGRTMAFGSSIGLVSLSAVDVVEQVVPGSHDFAGKWGQKAGIAIKVAIEKAPRMEITPLPTPTPPGIPAIPTIKFRD